jgi:hypothetical protein
LAKKSTINTSDALTTPKRKMFEFFPMNKTKGCKRIRVEQNELHAHILPFGPCVCKGLWFIEPSNTHNHQSYDIIFRKILATHPSEC